MTGKETIHALEDHYGKLLAFVMAKYNLPHVGFNQGGESTGWLLTDAEAIKLQALEDKMNRGK